MTGRARRLALHFVAMLFTLACATMAFANSEDELISFPAGIVEVPTEAGSQSADDAFGRVGMSMPWSEGGFLFDSRRNGTHFAAFARNRLLALLHRRGDFRFLPLLNLSRCEVWIRAMNFGAPEITELALQLKRMGVGRVMIIAHGPDGFEVAGGVSAPTNRASQLRARDNDMGREARRLMNAGFHLNPTNENDPYQIVVSEVPPRRGLQPLMHEKGVTVYIEKDEPKPGRLNAFVFWLRRLFGVRAPDFRLFQPNPYRRIFDRATGRGFYHLALTDNFTARPNPGANDAELAAGSTTVMNRFQEVIYPPQIEEELAHMRALARALRTTGRISDIAYASGRFDEYPAHRFADGSILQLAFTNGRVNHNDRMNELIERALRQPDEIQILSVVENQFVISHDPWIEAMRRLLLSSPATTYTVLADSSFISTRGPGLSSVLGGYVGRGDQGLHDPFPAELADRVRAFAYRRATPTARSAGQMLDHDKTTVFVVRIRGVEWVYVFSGSFNKSGRYQNAEWQRFGKFPRRSRMGRYYERSILSQLELIPELLMSMRDAAFASILGQFLGVPPTSIYVGDVERILSELARNNFGAVRAIAAELYARSDKKTIGRRDRSGRWIEEERVSEGELQQRLEALERFMSWYSENIIAPVRGYANEGNLGQMAMALLRRGFIRLWDQAGTGRGMMDPGQIGVMMDLIIDQRNAQDARGGRGRRASAARLGDLARARLLRSLPLLGEAGDAAAIDARIDAAHELWAALERILGLPNENLEDFREALREEQRLTQARLGSAFAPEEPEIRGEAPDEEASRARGGRRSPARSRAALSSECPAFSEER